MRDRGIMGDKGVRGDMGNNRDRGVMGVKENRGVEGVKGDVGETREMGETRGCSSELMVPLLSGPVHLEIQQEVHNTR